MSPLASLSSRDLAQPLVPAKFNMEESSSSLHTYLCLPFKKVCYPVTNILTNYVVRRVISVAFFAFAVLTAIQKESVLFTDGENIKATLLSSLIGVFSALTLEVFSGTLLSDLSLYQMDASLITLLPMSYFTLAQWELNEIGNAPLYEALYTALFALGSSALVTEGFRIGRKRQEDDRLDLSEGEGVDPETEEDGRVKVLASPRVEINDLHHPRKDMELRELPFMIKTIKGHLRNCYVIMTAGVVTATLGGFSEGFSDMCLFDQQAYVLKHSGVFLVAYGVSDFAQFHLTHSIKLYQKRANLDADLYTSPLKQRVKVIFQNLSGQTAGIFWAAMFPFSGHDYGKPGLDLFFRFLVGMGMSWKEFYEKQRYIAGFEVASSIAPPEAPVNDDRVMSGRYAACLNRLRLTKSLFNRHFDTTLKVVGGAFAVGGSAWFLFNGVTDNGPAVKESAYIAAIMLPVSFGIKVAIDFLHNRNSGLLMRQLKYNTSHNVAVLVAPYLFISQYMRITSSALEQEDINHPTASQYLLDGISWASFATSLGVTAASIKELPPTFLILLINSEFYKISQGDK